MFKGSIIGSFHNSGGSKHLLGSFSEWVLVVFQEVHVVSGQVLVVLSAVLLEATMVIDQF